MAYAFEVLAVNATGSSPFSAPSNTVTPAAPTAPGPPSNVAATAAKLQPPTALVLLEGGFVQPPADRSWIDDVVAAAPENNWAYGEQTLRAILRPFSEYDAAATLAPIAGAVPTLAVVSAQIEGRRELVEENAAWADVRFVASGHDVVGELGAALGGIVCDWLFSEVAA